MKKEQAALKLALEYRKSMPIEVLHSWAADMKKAAQDAMAEQPAQQQEPVAWLIDNDYTTVFCDIAEAHRNKGAKVEPLYTKDQL